MKVTALSLLCFSALAAFTSAAPAPKAKGVHKVSGKSQVYSLPLTRRKNPQHFYKGANGFFSSSPLNDQSNAEYVTQVSIGTPAQNFQVVIDTGSADLWVPTTKCGSSCNTPDSFNTAASSTYKATSSPFSIEYGEGDGVKGNYATDSVSVGGLAVTKQYFGAVTDGESFFQNNNDIDGLIGLGYPGLSVGGHPTFVFTAASQGVIDSAILGVYLGSESGTSNGGSLSFGGPDTSLFSGDLQYVDVQQGSGSGTYDFWWVNLNSVSYGDQSVTSDSSLAILDTGTSLIYLFDSTVQAFYQNINGASAGSGGVYNIDCSFKSQSPVTFTFDNGITITMRQEDLVIDNGDGTCIGGIASVGDDQSTQILGDTFLRAAYITYDGTKNQVGFAALAGN